MYTHSVYIYIYMYLYIYILIFYVSYYITRLYYYRFITRRDDYTTIVALTYRYCY